MSPEVPVYVQLNAELDSDFSWVSICQMCLDLETIQHLEIDLLYFKLICNQCIYE